MASSSSTSPHSLAWYYIIETLADSKAELPLLKGLINRVPNFYTNAPEQVQERVALRYLEELASRGIVSTKDNTGGTIEIPQSSVEFLCQNLTRPTDPCQPSESRIAPVSDHIRQFISQKKSTLPKPFIDLLKESVSGANAKLHSGSSSSHRQEDNIVDKEQEMITSPRSAGTEGATHNDASQNLPSQNALYTDKTASEPLQENNPTTVIGNVSDLEAARSEPLSDDIDQFILKRRDPVSKTLIEEPKEPIPETSIPIEPSSNENNNNLRSNADFLDDQSDYERFMGSPIPFSEQNQCIVCNKGGQLLTCSRKGCGITVHESCIMTTPSSFDKEGRFYCPCCACARAKKVFSPLFMASSSSTSPHSLAWYYIIETLADSKAELPLLKELINRVPNFYTNAPEQVQERVALRYLEELASRGIVGTKDNTSGTTEIPQSSVEFLCQNLTRPTDPCQPSESRIAPVSDHIRQFISQKKSTLPKPFIDLVMKLAVYCQNQEKGERGKQKVQKNITGKREGKKVVSSDDDTAEGENGDAAFVGSGDASSSSESDSGGSRRRVDKNGKRKEKRVKSNGRNASEDRDMLCKRREEAKKREADSAYSRLDKYIYVKSGPGATFGSPAAVPMNEETGNERREDKINADANRKRHRPTPR